MTPDYRTTEQWAALCRAIGERPGDDTVRLVAADWLDETAERMPCKWCGGSGIGHGIGIADAVPCHICNGSGWVSDGRAERAEFIRVQCELAGSFICLTPSAGASSDSWPNGLPCIYSRPRGKPDCLPWCEPCLRYDDLRKRERELLIGSPTSWGANGEFSDFLSRTYPNHDLDGFGWNFRRGFVDAVRGPLAALLGPRCAACMEPNEDVPHPKCRACHGTGRTPGDLERMGAELLAVRACEITDLLPDECLRPWRGCHFVYRSAAPPAFEERVNAECVVRDGDLYDEVCKLADYADNQAAGFVGQSHAGSARVWPDAARDALSRAVLAVARRRAGLEQPKRRN